MRVAVAAADERRRAPARASGGTRADPARHRLALRYTPAARCLLRALALARRRLGAVARVAGAVAGARRAELRGRRRRRLPEGRRRPPEPRRALAARAVPRGRVDQFAAVDAARAAAGARRATASGSAARRRAATRAHASPAIVDLCGGAAACRRRAQARVVVPMLDLVVARRRIALRTRSARHRARCARAGPCSCAARSAIRAAHARSPPGSSPPAARRTSKRRIARVRAARRRSCCDAAPRRMRCRAIAAHDPVRHHRRRARWRLRLTAGRARGRRHARHAVDRASRSSPPRRSASRCGIPIALLALAFLAAQIARRVSPRSGWPCACASTPPCSPSSSTPCRSRAFAPSTSTARCAAWACCPPTRKAATGTRGAAARCGLHAERSAGSLRAAGIALRARRRHHRASLTKTHASRLNVAPRSTRSARTALCVFTKALTGARCSGSAARRRPTPRVYFANHTSHGDFVLIWACLPDDLRARTRPVAGRGLLAQGQAAHASSRSACSAPC